MSAVKNSIVEIHTCGRWIPAAELRAVSHDQMRFSYLDEYVFGDIQIPISLTLPVGIFPPPMRDGLEQIARDCGVEKLVLDQCLHSIEGQARQLDELAV